MCILSYNRPIAKAFLSQIKRELESNELLKELFPEILWDNTNKAPTWSLDSGLLVKRTSNPKEATVEAFGLVEGSPVGRHYDILIYDDVVTRDSVSNPEMIKKTTEAWELSRALGTEGGVSRHVGTRYHFNDTYSVLLDRDSVKPRIYTATDNGKVHGSPVLIKQDELTVIRKEMGPYTFACQMMQDPRADSAKGFKEEWLTYWGRKNYHLLNCYIFVDPANEKKKHSDYTCMMVIGYGDDGNYYIIDMVRDRLNLVERTNKLFELQKKYHPLEVFYEKYGIQSDIQHIKYVQEEQNYRFNIRELGGTKLKKEDRIEMLVPLFEAGRIFLPRDLKFRDAEGRIRDLTQEFIKDEYLAFPVSSFDDMLDTLARILDDNVNMKSTSNKQIKFKPLQVKHKKHDF
jgi:predicted phage terminase large subunit-like protein